VAEGADDVAAIATADDAGDAAAVGLGLGCKLVLLDAAAGRG
jgi:hypothetical protein